MPGYASYAGLGQLAAKKPYAVAARDGCKRLVIHPAFTEKARHDQGKHRFGKFLWEAIRTVAILDRLGESEFDDIAASAASGSRLHLLCTSALQRRPSRALPAFRAPVRRPPEKLPSDEDLSRVADPQAVLLDLIKSRGMDQERKIQHALSSSYITDDLAWRVPVKTLGAIRSMAPGSQSRLPRSAATPRLAGRNSPARGAASLLNC